MQMITMGEIVLKCNNINKAFEYNRDRVQVLSDVSLSILRGQKIGLFGPSGSGKSTLIHILGLLDISDSGAVFVDGVDSVCLSAEEKAKVIAKKIGFIYQYPFLLSDLTVSENISFAGKVAEVEDLDCEVERLLERLQLAELRNKYPEMLSGGQRQRVAIARACIKKPLVIFADEPTANLDAKNAHVALDLLFETIDSIKSSLLMVTHDTSFKDKFDLAYILRDGKIV